MHILLTNMNQSAEMQQSGSYFNVFFNNKKTRKITYANCN